VWAPLLGCTWTVAKIYYKDQNGVGSCEGKECEEGSGPLLGKLGRFDGRASGEAENTSNKNFYEAFRKE
jgi:hypothetical protein